MRLHKATVDLAACNAMTFFNVSDSTAKQGLKQHMSSQRMPNILLAPQYGIWLVLELLRHCEEVESVFVLFFVSTMFANYPLLQLIVLVFLTCTRLRAQDLNSSSVVLNTTILDADARRLLEVLPDRTTTGKFGPDAVSIGNYTVIGCGSALEGSNEDRLRTLFPTMLDRLRLTISEADLGVAGFHGYNELFKDEKSKSSVKEVFQDIRIGKTIRTRTRSGDRVETPKLVCLGPEEDESHVTGIGNLYDFFCTGNFDLAVPVAQFRRTELVVLCPSFFTLAVWPTMRQCSRAEGGTLYPGGNELLRNQYSMLMRALAGVYIPNIRQPLVPVRPDLPTSLRSIAALTPAVALGRKDSYAYFAAGELLLLQSDDTGSLIR